MQDRAACLVQGLQHGKVDQETYSNTHFQLDGLLLTLLIDKPILNLVGVGCAHSWEAKGLLRCFSGAICLVF